MKLSNLANNLLDIIKAAAPLVGLGGYVEAGEKLVASIRQTIETSGDAFSRDDQAALQSALADLAARVNSHADRTAASLD